MTTIADIAREKTVIDNTDWFEGQDGSGSYKSHIAAIRGVGETDITTSAVSQDVGPLPQLVYITTGGTAGTELVNLVNNAFDIGGFVNVAQVGTRVTLVLAVQTDPADSVQVTVAGAADCAFYTPQSTVGIGRMSTIILDYVGACVTFVWAADTWLLDWQSTDFQFDGQPAYGDVNIGPHDVTGVGKNLTLSAGQGTTSNGLILVGTDAPLPTSDPHVANALWNNLGILTISSG